MAISRDEVLHVARLARLALSDEEIERLGAQLNAILEAVGKVTELDLADVEPTAHPLDLVNVWAEDEPQRLAPGRGRAGERARPRGRLLPGAACMRAPAHRHTLGPVPSPTRAPFLVRLVVGRRSGVPDLEAVAAVIDTLRLTAQAGQRPARDGRGVVGRDLRRVPGRDRRARPGAATASSTSTTTRPARASRSPTRTSSARRASRRRPARRSSRATSRSSTRPSPSAAGAAGCA